MFTFYCPDCSHKSFTVGRPCCLFCDTTEPRSISIDDNFHSPEPPRDLSIASGSKYPLLPNYTGMTNADYVHNIKRNVSKDEIIMDNNQAHGRSRNEISAKTSQAVPICREHNVVYHNNQKEIRPTSLIAFDNNPLDGIYHEYPNTNPQNQVMLGPSNLSKISRQNNASNISYFRSTPIKNPQSKILDFEASKRVPGPSGIQEIKDLQNSPGENFPSRSSLELQSSVFTDKKTLLCGLCIWDYHRHYFEREGKFQYECCRCSYTSIVMGDLQKHASSHCSVIFRCDICGELTFDPDAHGREKECKLCNEKFKCRTLLEQHTLVHRNYYKSHCRLCRREIAKHIKNPATKFYHCCYDNCRYNSYREFNFKCHLITHTGLKLFKCYVCERRFAHESSLSKHLVKHFQCRLCEKRFNSIEIHFKEEHAQA